MRPLDTPFFAVLACCAHLALGCGPLLPPDGDRPQGERPELTVESLRFYESKAGGVPFEGRAYSTSFPRRSTRFVFYELILTHPAEGRTWDLSLDVTYSRSDGTILDEWTNDFTIPPDWTDSVLSSGAGWHEPGNWPSGSYTARIQNARTGALIATGHFSIQDGAAEERFVDLGNGIVRDNLMGLEWQQGTGPGSGTGAGKIGSDDGTDYTWDEGVVYCNGLSLGGHTDWRLPTLDEMLTLFTDGVEEPFDLIITTYFPDTKKLYYWTSTPDEKDPERRWVVEFSFSTHQTFPKDSYSKVRAVRTAG